MGSAYSSNVSTLPSRLLNAAWSRSYSKSFTERTPRTKNCAPTLRAKSVAKSVYSSTVMRGSSAYSCRIASSRSSAEKRVRLSGFTPTPMTSMSTSDKARWAILSCPMVKGSKVPTKSATDGRRCCLMRLNVEEWCLGAYWVNVRRVGACKPCQCQKSWGWYTLPFPASRPRCS